MTQKYLEPSKKTRFSQRANRRVLDDAIDVSGTTNFGRYRDDNCSSVRYYSCSAPQTRNRKERAAIIGRWRVRVLSLNWPRHSTVSTCQIGTVSGTVVFTYSEGFCSVRKSFYSTPFSQWVTNHSISAWK